MKKEEIERMTAEELIKRYGIIIPAGNEKKIRTTSVYLMEHEGAEEAIKAHAKEIYSVLKAREEAEKKAKEERKAKENAIPGLKEILSAYADIWAYEDEWEDSFDDVGGLGVRPEPKHNFKEMREKYPQAFAYIKAINLESNTNSRLAETGRKAMDQVLNGEWRQALEDMKNAIAEEKKKKEEWLANHMWD